MKPLVLIARLVFGAWMVVNSLNHFFFSFWPDPVGHEPLAEKLMTALVDSGLLNVALTIQLVAGALILTGYFVPVALCVLMPVSTCALFWSLILEHQTVGAALALIAFAMNGLLMLAYIDSYKGALQRHALALSESGRMSFDSLFTSPRGRASRGQFAAALITLAAVAAFYAFVVTGRNAHWCMLVLVIPALILHARRLHDIGHSAWLLWVPGALVVAAFASWLDLVALDSQLKTLLGAAALAVSGGFALWGCFAKGQAEANRFGAPVSA